jgi:hypothetical protein
VEPAANEPAHLGPLRTKLYYQLGIYAGDPMVVDAARALSTRFLGDPTAVDASLAGAALAVTAFHGNAKTYEDFQAALERTDLPAARENLIAALGSFHDPGLAARALQYSLGPKLNSTEFLDVVQSLAPMPERREQAVDWAMAHFDAIRAKAPAPYLASLIYLATGDEPELFAKMQTFLLDPAHVNQFIAKNVTKSAEGSALRTRLRAKEGAAVEAYLSTFPGAAGQDRH